MKEGFTICLMIFALMSDGVTRAAQGNTNQGANSLLTQIWTNLIDPNRAFSGIADVTIMDEVPVEVVVGVCGQDGNLRIACDLSSQAGGVLPPEMEKRIMEGRKAQGLDRYVVLLRKGDPLRYVIYPGRRAYHTNDFMSFSSASNLDGTMALKKVEGGMESIDSHICQKVELQMTDGKDSKTLVTCWQAKDMGDFPMKIQLAKDMTVIFRQVKFGRLDPMLFQVPKDYRAMSSVQDIEADVLNQGGTNPPLAKPIVRLKPLKHPSELVIRSAEFGAGKNVTDVTTNIIRLLEVHPEGFYANVQTLGKDPLPGKPKLLTIRYDFNETNHVMTVDSATRIVYSALVLHAL